MSIKKVTGVLCLLIVVLCIHGCSDPYAEEDKVFTGVLTKVEYHTGAWNAPDVYLLTFDDGTLIEIYRTKWQQIFHVGKRYDIYKVGRRNVLRQAK